MFAILFSDDVYSKLFVEAFDIVLFEQNQDVQGYPREVITKQIL